MTAQSLRPVDELLWSWPTVCKVATNDWAKSFAQSIHRQSRRPNWMPTPKQHVLMQRMVAELYRHIDDDGDLIEVDE